MTVEQLPLFPGDRPRSAPVASEESGSGATTVWPFNVAVERFREHMIAQQFAENTVKSFLGDLRILKRFLRGNPPVGQIGTKDLRQFLHWLQHERGAPCSPKSYARRLTTLKVFFAWLASQGVLPSDPAAPLIHKPAQPPLPRILSDGEVEQALTAARALMSAEKSDPRPYLLFSLVLHTGVKKQECMGIKLAHIDTCAPDGPALHIRYENPRMRLKERRLSLPPGWDLALAHYRRVYEPVEFLFPCTARNLEYVLADLARRAGLSGGISFEMLRWTCAVRDYRARMDGDRLRRKLGLSQMTWKDAEPKIVRLAEPPL